MKICINIILLALLPLLGRGQADVQLAMVKETTGGRYNLVLLLDSIPTDTILNSGFYRILDYKFKSESEIAILMEGGSEAIHYTQLYKSAKYQFWYTDSTVIWLKSGWLYYHKNPHIKRITYALKDFHTVVETINDSIITLDIQKSKRYNPSPLLYERELEFVIEKLIDDSTTSWQSLDSLYKNEIVPTSSQRVRQIAFQRMVWKKQFLEKADTASLTFYAHEMANLDFYYGMKDYLNLMQRLKEFWPPDQLAIYARTLYQTQSKYWKAKFNRSYWSDKPEEEKVFKALMRMK